MDKKKELTKFVKSSIEQILQNNSDATFYYHFGNGLYFVIAKDYNECIKAKIAYNCDDLQYDFDFDWYFVEYQNSDCYICEYEINQNNIDFVVNDAMQEYENIIKLYKKGAIKKWSY